MHEKTFLYKGCAKVNIFILSEIQRDDYIIFVWLYTLVREIMIHKYL